MKRFIEVSAQWKFGNVIVRMPTSININAICRVEKFPEELPDYLDGINCRIHLGTGEAIPVNNQYDSIMEIIKDLEL